MVKARILHSGGLVCLVEARPAKCIRLGLQSKSGRLVSS